MTQVSRLNIHNSKINKKKLKLEFFPRLVRYNLVLTNSNSWKFNQKVTLSNMSEPNLAGVKNLGFQHFKNSSRHLDHFIL